MMFNQDFNGQNQRELEQQIIGSLLIDPAEVIPEVADILRPEYFYFQPHQKIVARILELYNQQKIAEINPAGLFDTLSECGLSISEIAEMMTHVLTTRFARDFCLKLRNIHLLREAQRVAQKILAQSGALDDDKLQNLLNEFQNDLQRISDRQQSSSQVKTMADVLKEVTDDVFEDKPQNVLKTGISKLDNFVGGFRDDELIVLAGRTAMGKTAFSLSMLDNMLRQGKNIAYFTLEMSAASMVKRMISAVGHINSMKWKLTDDNNKLKLAQNPDDVYRITNAVGLLSRYPGKAFWIDSPHTVEDIRAKVRKLKRTEGLDGVFIDYLSLITPTYPNQTPNEHLTHSIRTLKMMAKEMGIPVVALAQINRAVESRQDKRPLLSDLKDSGNIEQEADIVLLLYRDAYYNPPATPQRIEEIEIIVAKNRNGAVGTIKAGYVKEFTKVIDLSKMQQENNKVIDLSKVQGNNREPARF